MPISKIKRVRTIITPKPKILRTQHAVPKNFTRMKRKLIPAGKAISGILLFNAKSSGKDISRMFVNKKPSGSNLATHAAKYLDHVKKMMINTAPLKSPLLKMASLMPNDVKVMVRSINVIQYVAGETMKNTSKYSVEKGDNLWNLAESKYGDPTLWPAILFANSKIEQQDLIFPDQNLKIPVKDEAEMFCMLLKESGISNDNLSALINFDKAINKLAE